MPLFYPTPSSGDAGTVRSVPDAASAELRWDLEVDGPVVVRHTLTGASVHADPTREVRGDVVSLAARTPLGPATLRAEPTAPGRVRCSGWGPGAQWLAERGDALLGVHDDPRAVRFDHDRLDELHRRNQGMRHGAPGTVVDHLLARVLGQRVLAAEAVRSWFSLCRALGGPAPGPGNLLLPPDPERLAERPPHWFHPHGVDGGRARTLRAVAANARRLHEVVDLPLPEAYGRLRAVPGLGPWTVNGVARTALGDPDAIVVGDYWICHTVCSFLTGADRGSDAEMLALVEPWRGQRGRVERLIHRSGHRIQRRGPGKPTPDLRSL